jgi:hypothetical protein
VGRPTCRVAGAFVSRSLEAVEAFADVPQHAQDLGLFTLDFLLFLGDLTHHDRGGGDRGQEGEGREAEEHQGGADQPTGEAHRNDLAVTDRGDHRDRAPHADSQVWELAGSVCSTRQPRRGRRWS